MSTPGSAESDVIAEGYWCSDCEFYESGDDMCDLDCHACGCRREDHVRVSLVRVAPPAPTESCDS